MYKNLSSANVMKARGELKRWQIFRKAKKRGKNVGSKTCPIRPFLNSQNHQSILHRYHLETVFITTMAFENVSDNVLPISGTAYPHTYNTDFR